MGKSTNPDNPSRVNNNIQGPWGDRDKDSLQTDYHTPQPPSLPSHETPHVVQESQESGSALKTGGTSSPISVEPLINYLSVLNVLQQHPVWSLSPFYDTWTC